MKKTFLIIFSVLIVFPGLAQRAFMEIPDSSDYYTFFWQKNIDTLQKQWHFNEFFNAEVNDYNFESIDFSKINLNNRSEEILKLYIKNYPQSAKALAINKQIEDTLSEIFLTNKLPESYKLLPFAFTAMNPIARSSSGAYSYFQMQYAASRVYNLNIDSYVDQRKQIIKSAHAAAKYIAHLSELYGDYNLSLIAYSCGPRNLNKALRRNNNIRNIDSLYNSLPNFGKDIVYAMQATIAFDSIIENTNINLPEFKSNFEIDTIEVSKRLHFTQLADVLNVSVDSIRFMNPQYKYDIIPADDEVYLLLMPKGYLAKFNKLEDSIYNYKDSILFDLHKKIILPPPPKGRSYARYEPEPIPEGSKVVYYHIKSGDNLGFISEWYDVSVRELKDWNNIYNERRLQLNQKLKIYVPEEKYSYYSNIDKKTFNQKQNLSGEETTTETKKKEPLPLGDDYFYHTVKSGESPYLIAKKYPGVSADDIVRWNNIDPRDIRPGDKLRIKKIK